MDTTAGGEGGDMSTRVPLRTSQERIGVLIGPDTKVDGAGFTLLLALPLFAKMKVQ